MPLVEIAPRTSAPRGSGPTPPRTPARHARPSDAGHRPTEIKNEKDLEAYEHLFANVDFWKRIGEEYQNPLIVTGTVLFTPHQRSASCSASRKCSTRSAGAVSSRSGRSWNARASSSPEVHLHRRPLRRDDLLRAVPRGAPVQRAPEHPCAVLVLRADGRLVPKFLNTLSTQRSAARAFCWNSRPACPARRWPGHACEVYGLGL